jgi:predicted O-methyltransferase YrrM
MDTVTMGFEYLESMVGDAMAAGRYFDYGADEAERIYLAKIASSPGVKVIAEIGFNAGYSSYAFLSASPDSLVYSFDLVAYDYSLLAKHHIDETFPDRHTLVKGNSLHTVPDFCWKNPGLKFDLIFIDGGHTYDVAKADLLNMRALAGKDTVLVVDDITPWKPCGIGPTRAWVEALREGVVIQDELIREGEKVAVIEPPGDRLWAVGKYKM